MKAIQAPLEEQEICVKCGFCCDGTLFQHAILLPGERGTLPEKMEQNYVRDGETEYFRQPCEYFSVKCTIYNEKKANVCGSYRCQLLKDFADHKLSHIEAIEIIKQTRSTRIELLEQFRAVTGINKEFTFSHALHELIRIQKNKTINEDTDMDLDILLARFNIFESQLTKYFKSSGRFESLIIPDDRAISF